MTISMKVIGDQRMIRTLQTMRRTASRRTMTAGSAEASKVASKKIKQSVPSRYKSMRKAIAWRRLKAKEAPDGGAKAGGNVGRASRVTAADRTGRKGIGMRGRNIHWAFLGTANRRTATRFTGRMGPLIPSVKTTMSSSRGELFAAWRRGAARQFVKEVQKGKAF